MREVNQMSSNCDNRHIQWWGGDQGAFGRSPRSSYSCREYSMMWQTECFCFCFNLHCPTWQEGTGEQRQEPNQQGPISETEVTCWVHIEGISQIQETCFMLEEETEVRHSMHDFRRKRWSWQEGEKTMIMGAKMWGRIKDGLRVQVEGCASKRKPEGVGENLNVHFKDPWLSGASVIRGPDVGE